MIWTPDTVRGRFFTISDTVKSLYRKTQPSSLFCAEEPNNYIKMVCEI